MATNSLHLEAAFLQSKKIEQLIKRQLQTIYDMAILSCEMSKKLRKNKKNKMLVEQWHQLVRQLM